MQNYPSKMSSLCVFLLNWECVSSQNGLLLDDLHIHNKTVRVSSQTNRWGSNLSSLSLSWAFNFLWDPSQKGFFRSFRLKVLVYLNEVNYYLFRTSSASTPSIRFAFFQLETNWFISSWFTYLTSTMHIFKLKFKTF